MSAEQGHRGGGGHGNAAGSSICLRRGASPSQLFSRGNTNAIGAKSVAYNRRPNTKTHLTYTHINLSSTELD